MTTCQIIDGAAIAADVRVRVGEAVAEHRAQSGDIPGLATILVGEDPASQVYVRRKHEACEEVGIRSFDFTLAPSEVDDRLTGLIDECNGNDQVSGILLQLPLPAGQDPAPFVAAIDPSKDVDGLTAVNAGRLAQGLDALVPCTPAGVMELLGRQGVQLSGADAVVVGRSTLVGRPLASLLLQADATVTVCHSRTRDLAGICRRADVLIAAVGAPGLITGEMIKPGAVVIDVGINRTDSGLVGDVNFDQAIEVASAITPVPGGVGPMTIAMLLANTLKAARLSYVNQTMGVPR